MTKNEVIKNVAAKAEMKNKDVEVVLEAFHDVIVEVLQADTTEKISVGDLGAFKVKEVPERSGISALGGKEWTKPAHNELVFKVSKAAKDF